METNEKKIYEPFSPVHPFDILEEELEARGITKKEFAIKIGMHPSNFTRMLKKKGELTSEMALKLEDKLGIPYLDWMHYQEAYLKDKRRTGKKKIPVVEILRPTVTAQHGISAFLS